MGSGGSAKGVDAMCGSSDEFALVTRTVECLTAPATDP